MRQELIVVLIAAFWIGLFYVEKLARRGGRYLTCAWIAYTCRPIIFFTLVSIFLIFVGTNSKPSAIELVAGIIAMVVGLGMGITRIVKRREIQEKLKSGEIESSGTEY